MHSSPAPNSAQPTRTHQPPHAHSARLYFQYPIWSHIRNMVLQQGWNGRRRQHEQRDPAEGWGRRRRQREQRDPCAQRCCETRPRGASTPASISPATLRSVPPPAQRQDVAQGVNGRKLGGSEDEHGRLCMIAGWLAHQADAGRWTCCQKWMLRHPRLRRCCAHPVADRNHQASKGPRSSAYHEAEQQADADAHRKACGRAGQQRRCVLRTQLEAGSDPADIITQPVGQLTAHQWPAVSCPAWWPR